MPTFSNGSVYADLDNDGDLDIVVNNMESPVLVYENKTSNKGDSAYLHVRLRGSVKNLNAVGARVVLFSGSEVRTYEKFPARGFMSSMEIPLHVGLRNTKVDSLLLIWPDHTYQRLPASPAVQTIAYQAGLPRFDFSRLTQSSNEGAAVKDITKEVGLNFVHQENHFVEFDREPLIPHMVSTEGPALAVADINGDGLEDVFVGAARNKKSAVFLQQASGSFLKAVQPALDADSIYEDVDACFTDVNRDGYADLVVASGGNEYYGNDPHNTPRVYVNNGQGNLTLLKGAFEGLYLTASCVIPYDFNSDGYTDLFVGGRVVPWEYGQVPRSYLLLNDRKGRFVDVSDRYAKGLGQAGFVTQAQWFDLDGDQDLDLLLALEWGGITAFINNGGKFSRKTLTDHKGWWNSVYPCDVDGDGDIDLVAGNLGHNSRLKASPEKPVRLYYNDFDGNGKKEQVLTYYIGEKEMPFASKAELEKQMPILKKKFLYAEDFAKASLADLFGRDKLDNAHVLTANYFSNALLLNKGGLQFDVQALPWKAQLSPLKDAMTVNVNGDSLPDLLLLGNYYDNNNEMGRYDADYGTLLVNKGKGQFESKPMKGSVVKGQVRHIRPIRIGGRVACILAKNSDSLKVIQFSSGKD